MRKRSNSTSGLNSEAQAWLQGDPSCGWIRFRNQDELAALWETHGDKSKFYWRNGHKMMLPISRAELKEHEDAWLSSGADDQYGMSSHFIAAHYTDDDKHKLWTKRGDKTRFRWRVGMRRPELIRAATRNEPALGQQPTL